MSVNVYDKSKVGTADELTPVATMGRNRVWTGTKAAAEAAMRNGDIGNGTVVYITDDYDDKTVIDTANYAVTAGVANEAKEAEKANKAKDIEYVEDTQAMDFNVPYKNGLGKINYTLSKQYKNTPWGDGLDAIGVYNIMSLSGTVFEVCKISYVAPGGKRGEFFRYWNYNESKPEWKEVATIDGVLARKYTFNNHGLSWDTPINLSNVNQGVYLCCGTLLSRGWEAVSLGILNVYRGGGNPQLQWLPIKENIMHMKLSGNNMISDVGITNLELYQMGYGAL